VKEYLQKVADALSKAAEKVRADENLSLRLLALGLAVVLWFVAVGDERFAPMERQVVVPVEVQNVPEGLALVEELGEATVTLRGLNPMLGRAERSIEAVVDASLMDAGTTTARISVETPLGISAVSTVPSRVPVTLEPWEEQEFPVAVALVGVPEGYQPGRYATTPSQAVVRAPSSVMARVSRVAVYVEARNGIEEGQYALRALDGNWQDVEPLEIAPDAVELHRRE